MGKTVPISNRKLQLLGKECSRGMSARAEVIVSYPGAKKKYWSYILYRICGYEADSSEIKPYIDEKCHVDVGEIPNWKKYIQGIPVISYGRWRHFHDMVAAASMSDIYPDWEETLARDRAFFAEEAV